MRRITVLLALAAICFLGCGGSGGDSATAPTSETWAWEGVTYTRSSPSYQRVDGTLRNASDTTQHVRSVYFKAWDGNVVVDDGHDFLDEDVAPGGGVQFSVLVMTEGRSVTRWEYWVEQ